MRLPSLLDITATESDDEFGAGASSSTPKFTTVFKMPPARKASRGRPAANRVTKAEPKAATRRTEAKKAKAAEDELERQGMMVGSGNASKTKNHQQKTAASKSVPRGRPAKVAAAAMEDEAQQAGAGEEALATPPASDEPVRAKATRGRPRKDASVLNSVVKGSQSVVGGAKRGRKPGKAAQAAPTPAAPEVADESSEIPETQYDEAMDVEYSEEMDQVEDLPAYAGHSVPSSARPGHSYDVALGTSKRSNSVPSGFGDPSASRRLIDLTRKYEALEARYRDLKNLAVTEAERTFDRLKKTSEEKTQSANKLIASLKEDLEAQKKLAKEGAKSQQQLEASEAKVETLQTQVAELSTWLDDSKKEIKVLTVKLSAARTAETAANAQAQAAGVRMPGSAMKPGVMAARGLDGGALQAAQTAKMKENLYSDLTGLVVASIKRDGPEDVYDCVQTGRNGTLHFKLAIPNEATDEEPEGSEFMYKPQLDERRDRELIDLLPDYLTDEITFQRPQAAKFYVRVLKSLTERVD
ncbi:chromosome segregation protein Csm1/Pcs1-domain-containing protein [Coniella lustricola]|uniref:Chromosome segregation protein Csm1/Pcs1-domain-containing protein n=1 Tax=Coniella lustricola TaxID=2025994 RepID=A0A2T2ZVX6_9PEZI|nr:chromosome segregation protein Csm1/Pcs1-domain-containing protein [Coniella lustricola]